MADRVFDSAGRELWPDAIVGRGGEGVVRSIRGDPLRVVKLYDRAPAAGKTEKLLAMTRLASRELLEISAWPVGTVHGTAGGPVIGVIMPRISGHREIHRLYGPAHRKTEFPAADWEFLLRVARNLAAAFDTVHAAGHVAGDVNQGNVLVSPQGLVQFIDCDSFQIQAGARVYPCEVGMAHFTPPELQNRSLAGLVRTRDHDLFGLAVLCFHLLFMGRHPFAGRHVGTDEMPIERAIAQLRFAFGRDAPARAVSPPPHSLSLAQVPASVAGLFERAFSVESARGAARPGAREWVDVLETAERRLGRCLEHPGHAFDLGSQGCPWCRIEQEGGPDFFAALAPVARGKRDPFDPDKTWEDILAVPSPLEPPGAATSPRRDAPLEVSRAAHRPGPAGRPPGLLPDDWPDAPRRWGLLWAVLLAGLYEPWLAIAVVALVSALLAVRADPRGPVGTSLPAEGHGQTPEPAPARSPELGEFVRLFDAKRAVLAGLRDAYARSSGPERSGPANHLEPPATGEAGEPAGSMSLDAWLGSHLIERADLPGIGYGLKATLAAYGVETAADVTLHQLRDIPGLGSIRGQALMRWRSSLEHAFEQERKPPTRYRKPGTLRGRPVPERERLERDLTQGLEDLRRLSALGRAAADRSESAGVPSTGGAFGGGPPPATAVR